MNRNAFSLQRKIRHRSVAIPGFGHRNTPYSGGSRHSAIFRVVRVSQSAPNTPQTVTRVAFTVESTDSAAYSKWSDFDEKVARYGDRVSTLRSAHVAHTVPLVPNGTTRKVQGSMVVWVIRVFDASGKQIDATTCESKRQAEKFAALVHCINYPVAVAYTTITEERN